jgi:hypothetical protein
MSRQLPLKLLLRAFFLALKATIAPRVTLPPFVMKGCWLKDCMKALVICVIEIWSEFIRVGEVFP